MIISRINIMVRMQSTSLPLIKILKGCILLISLASELDVNYGKQQDRDCDDRNKFRCSRDGRCIPKEWACDFTKQCLDGEDEYGCNPKVCNFKEDSCNWFNVDHPDETPIKDSWHRYDNTYDQTLTSRLKMGETSTTNILLNSSFLYTQLNETINESIGLRSQTIGQTDAMCQLRFKYMVLFLNTHYSYTVNFRFQISSQSSKELKLWESNPISVKTKQDWRIEVIELGHLRNFNIELSARLKRKTIKSSNIIERDIDEIEPYKADVIVALDWIEFKDCSWPQGSRDSDDFTIYEIENLDTIEPNSTLDFAFTCSPNKFKCHNGICLEKDKLCNWVDDCCSTWDTNIMNEVEGYDESLHICNMVPGMENFEGSKLTRGPNENTTIASSTMKRVTGKPSHAFWTMGAYWPEFLVNIRDSQTEIANRLSYHLPRTDHTLGTSEGHYLSLELPSKASPGGGQGQSSELDQDLYWLYLDSPWMHRRKLSLGSCRIKFFFNLVSDGSADLTPTRFVLLAVEHFVLKRESSLREIKAKRIMNELLYTDDSNILSNNIKKMSKHHGKIEYSGVDYWRSVNIDLKDLNENDLFFVRILVIFNGENRPSRGPEGRATMNIDDLSTHLGCSIATSLGSDDLSLFREFKRNQSNPLIFPEGSIFEATDKSFEQQLNLNHGQSNPEMTRTIDEDSTNGAKKLITCVAVILAALIGLISMLVFIVVPFIERFTMRNIQGNMRDTRNMDNFADVCEMANGFDWLESSRSWRQSAPSELYQTTSTLEFNSNISSLNSDSYRKRMNEADFFSNLNLAEPSIAWPESPIDERSHPLRMQATRRASIF